MPQVFKVGALYVFFWSDEGEPLEPVHVHVAEGKPQKNATKIWITKAGKCLLCHNASRIAPKALANVIKVIEVRSNTITNKWRAHFGEIRFYC